jgi:hypothetical protein
MNLFAYFYRTARLNFFCYEARWVIEVDALIGPDLVSGNLNNKISGEVGILPALYSGIGIYLTYIKLNIQCFIKGIQQL